MDPRDRWSWLTSRRFIRWVTILVAGALLAVVLYNATAVDRIPPTFTIELSNPAKGSNLALTRTSIDVVFSEDVKRETAQAAFSISPAVAGSFNWQGSSQMIFTPSQKLPLGTAFRVQMKPGVEDLAGNVQGSSSSLAFTTVTAPAVTTLVPAAGSKAVAVNSAIQITFDRFMDTVKVLSGIHIEPAIAFQPTWSGQVLTLTPARPLQFGTTYTLTVGDPAVDTDGTPLAAPYVASFTTVGVGLHITSVVPAPNVAGVSIYGQIALVFDGQIEPASIQDALNVTPTIAGSIQIVALSNDTSPPSQASPSPSQGGGNVLVFTPSQPLGPHTTYTVTLSPVVRSLDGEVAEGRTWSFTTGEAPTTAQNQIVFLSDRSGVRNLWLMNPDGTNAREITSELVPISGFDVSGDGSQVVYGAGGVVKLVGISGGSPQALTSPGNYEYAPMFTPDATGIILGRRDATGADQGYWRVPIVSGADQQQLLPDGAPGLGSVSLGGDGLTASAGTPSWAPRAAFSEDGKLLLIVRGSDGEAELVDLTGASPPRSLGLKGEAAPVWVQSQQSFYVVASLDDGSQAGLWQVPRSGPPVRVGAAVGSVAASSSGALALLVPDASGGTHLGFAAFPAAGPTTLVNAATWSERSPSFSPDGSTIVFGRVRAQAPTVSAGIWIVKTDGTGLENLAPDGEYPRWMP